MVDKNFIGLSKPDITRFESYLPTAFSSELTLLQKVNKIIQDLNRSFDLTNEMVEYLNHFIETFDKRLYTKVEDILMKWLEDGTMTEIILDAILKVGDLSHFREFDLTVMEKMKNEFEERGLNVKWFGVSGDGITDDTENIQRAFDYMLNLNKGRLILSETYKLSKPIVIDRISENNIQNIVFTGGGLFVKNPNAFSNAKRLFTLKIGFHDEDNIVFDNLSFDGYDHSINGFDSFNENIPYNDDGANYSDGNQTKFITFNRCIFKNFYRGMRLSSLSFSFRDCLFQGNIYGFFGNLAFNNNNFFNCQFRRNTVGCHIKQLSSSLGSVQNNFYGCNFESNRNVGLIIDGAYYTLLSGVYFENNGYNYSTLAIQPTEKTHILTKGNIVFLTIQNLFCNLDTDSLIYSEGSLGHLRIENSTGHKIKTRNIYGADVGGLSFDLIELYNPYGQQSSFTSQGIKYVSHGEQFFIESNLGANYNENYSYSKTTPIVTNTPIFSGDFKDGVYLVGLKGFISSANLAGNNYARGVVDVTLGVVKNNGNLKLTIIESNLKSISEYPLTRETTEITVVNNTLVIKNLQTEGIPDIGQPTQIMLNYSVVVSQKYENYNSITTDNYIFE